MDLFKQGMKGPTRPAPNVPTLNVNRYSPVTNWNDDPFGINVFEPTPQYAQKKKPPPRPPPPKVKQPDVPVKPSHFIRKPTVLSSLLSRKNKAALNNQSQNHTVNPNGTTLISDFSNELEPHKMFPKCEPKIIQTAALIDLSSPPSSPTFTTRSSSDGLSVDSFGSDATTSTNHQNVLNGGNASQAESGFEDDFELFLSTRKPLAKDDTLDDFTLVDPFSPQTQPVCKPPLMKKPLISKDLLEVDSSFGQGAATAPKGPTIIRAKPARPKPPDNSSLLKTTFGNSFPVTTMNVNTTTPIQKIYSSFEDNFESKTSLWEEEERISPEREWSPPMPSVPPPPLPADASDEELTAPDWSVEDPAEEPHAIALFDYFTDHPDDLCFSAGARITLVRRVDKEWMYGRLRGGNEGLFPASYADVKVRLPDDTSSACTPPAVASATALYDFHPDQPGDLRFRVGDNISVLYKLSDEWYFGECNGLKGQFPANYVQMT